MIISKTSCAMMLSGDDRGERGYGNVPEPGVVTEEAQGGGVDETVEVVEIVGAKEEAGVVVSEGDVGGGEGRRRSSRAARKGLRRRRYAGASLSSSAQCSRVETQAAAASRVSE